MGKKFWGILFVSFLFCACGNRALDSSICSLTSFQTKNYQKENLLRKSQFKINNQKLELSSLKLPPLGIVGGLDLSSAPTTTSCGAVSPSGATSGSNSYYNIAENNTVFVAVNPNGGACSGSIVGKSADNQHLLILTAAHCFNGLSNGTNQQNITVGLSNTYSSRNSDNSKNSLHWWKNEAYSDGNPLYDIAWVETDGVFTNNYKVVPIATTYNSTEEKLFIGYGYTRDHTSQADDQNDPWGTKRCVSTFKDPNYHSRGDIIMGGLVNSFDSQYGTNAFENYLSVFGPINGTNSLGTCSGDSGGPTYVWKSSQWALAGLTQGSSTLLTPHPITDFSSHSSATGLSTSSNFNSTVLATCADGYGIYTKVINYANWVYQTTGCIASQAYTLTTIP